MEFEDGRGACNGHGPHCFALGLKRTHDYNQTAIQANCSRIQASLNSQPPWLGFASVPNSELPGRWYAHLHPAIHAHWYSGFDECATQVRGFVEYQSRAREGPRTAELGARGGCAKFGRMRQCAISGTCGNENRRAPVAVKLSNRALVCEYEVSMSMANAWTVESRWGITHSSLRAPKPSSRQ